MTRIIIADDMPLQVRELSKTIRANWPEWEILTAYDGEEIIRLASAGHVDIVLSDIRMPRMDGLEMLSVVRRISPKTKVVFITAYPLFEYAQQALKLGATDFLLKPVDPPALYDLLSRLSSEDSAADPIREDLCQWLNRDWNALESTVQERVGGSFSTGGICTVIAPASDTFPLPRHLAADLGRATGCTIFAVDMDASADTRRYALVYTGDEWNYGQFLQALQTSSIRNGFRAGVSEWSGNLPRVGSALWLHSCQGAEEAFYGSASIVRCDKPYCFKSAEFPYAQKLLSWFGDQEDWRSHMKRLLESIGRNRPDAQELVHDTRRALRDCAKLLTRDGEEVPPVGSELRLIAFFSEYCVCLEKAMTALEKLYQESIKRADPVEMAMDYVRKHYMDPISLTEVAEMTHLSPNYFSTLFRKRTSLRFMEYVLQVRLEKASEMLANTEMYVYEIANACGYEDVRYFVRVYQKAYGISPANFRRCFRKEKTGK